MTAPSGSPVPAAPPRFVDLFTPKLVTVLREGYGVRQLRADVLAGLTVAVVALPLSMAIAIASGVSPDRGLYAAIVGGFFVSALGGSRFQIGGPAGAFIVLVAATGARHGLDGLLLAVLMSGVFLAAAGFLRLGAYIKFIPYPVTVGFTAGIAVIIFASQLRPLLGLTLPGPEPGPLVDKLPALWAALPTGRVWAVVTALAAIALIVAVKRWRPAWPGMLIAVAATSAAAFAFGLPVETIGSRFGGIPAGLPAPGLPEITLARAQAVLPDAIAFALLGSIESLLSAVVSDGMTGRRHRSNCELVAQGAANIGSALFGGICVTGAIARTATNIRAGAVGPVSGIVHSAALLAFMLLAAPLASYIPLAALAGVLATVAWNMVERHAFAALLRGSRGDALVLLATFGLTVFRDLTEAILVGFSLGAVLFIHRMSRLTAVETHAPFVAEDRADDAGEARAPYDPAGPAGMEVLVHRITGAFFFGAVSAVDQVLDRIAVTPKALIFDFSASPFLDSSGAHSVAAVVGKGLRQDAKVYLTATNPQVRRELKSHGLRPPETAYLPSVDAALADWKERKGGGKT